MIRDREVCWAGKGEAHSPAGSSPVLSLGGIVLPQRPPSGAVAAAAGPRPHPGVGAEPTARGV